MSTTRWITEMGMGVDVRGRDYTKAARRAVFDALRHSSLNLFNAAGKSRDDMHVDVMIGCADPDAVDLDAVADEVPYGVVTVRAEKGGLNVPPIDADGTGGVTIACAAILVSFPD
ncbi:MAG: Lin0512 family protein [Acidimicrobiales bacterium]|jgi:uncharacterized protein (TIGR02058 family)|nr:Lin0512 family protein [Acidimicrobiales bacterium]|tara:strand:- start:124 stop:468 length:345 start_codon:yes stop_codon:yes gene_type:complete